jgi:hypothetical protein
VCYVYDEYLIFSTSLALNVFLSDKRFASYGTGAQRKAGGHRFFI